MKALILAAGKGTRLRAAGHDVPKPLIDAGGITPLQHAAEWVAEVEPERIWVNVHAGAQQIVRALGERVRGVPISYSYEPELLGTAGAWKKLQDEWTETSLVIYGDNIMRFELRALFAAHVQHGALVTIAVFDPAVHRNTGIGGGRVQLEGARVCRFVEGATEGIVNAGAYVIDPALALLLPEGFLDFGHDVLPSLASNGELAAHMMEAEGYCLGVDTPERLQIARELVGAGEVRA